MTTRLAVSEHIQVAGELLEESDEDFALGKTLKGSEMLWGAVAHALIAIAQRHGWPDNSHGALKDVARRLTNVPGLPEWLSEFNTAERFHIHFYHGTLTERRIENNRPKVHALVHRLLAELQ